MIEPSGSTRLRSFAAGILSLVCVATTSHLSLPAVNAQALGSAAAEPSQALATIDGKPLTRQEVAEAASNQWEQVELDRMRCEATANQNRHRVLEQTVERMVRDRLVQAEAETAGVPMGEWLTQQKNSHKERISDAEIDSWYEQNQAQIRRPKAAVTEQIRDLLANQRFIEWLKTKHQISYQVEPYRVELEEADSPAHGPFGAPVTIVEFSDFQCPYCKNLNPSLEKVKEAYGNQVRLVFRQFPLETIHPFAEKAAQASLCAGDQEKFWEMHDLLFAEQQNLAVEDLKEKAARLELDAGKFESCLDSGKYAEKVQEDLRAGSRVGVGGTPALFVNGRFFSGVLPFEQLAAVIDEELKRWDADTPGN